MSIKATLRGYVADTARALERAPVEGALAFVTAIFFSYSLEAGRDFDISVRFAITAFIAAAGAWIGTLLYALGAFTYKQRWISTAIGALVAVLYLLFTPAGLAYEAEGWRAAMMLGAALLFIFAAPAWAGLGADPSLRLRRINARIVQRAISIGIYAAALFAGLALALMAIDKLFELKLHGTIYGHVFIWIVVVLVPWVILGGINEYVRPLEEEAGIGMFQQRLVVALVPVLVAIYYLILCAYALRIAITGELPNNLVSPLVIAAGLLVALSLILFDPLPNTAAGIRWLRYTPAVFIALGVLGIWAITTRTNAYGWTEFRLIRFTVLVTMLLLAVLGTVQLIRRRAFALRIIPTLLGAVLFIGAIGPWSVLNIARRDQRHRLASVLARAHVNVAPRTPADTAVQVIAAPLYDQINSISSYLQQNFGDSALVGVIPRAAVQQMKARGLAAYYALRPATPVDSLVHTASLQLKPETHLRIGGADVYRVEFYGTPGLARMSHDTLHVNAGGAQLEVPLAGVIARVPIGGVVPEKGAQLDSASAVAAAFDHAGAKRGDLLILELLVLQKKGLRSVSRLSGVLTIPAH